VVGQTLIPPTRWQKACMTQAFLIVADGGGGGIE
jgi:hypothetical protein